jgi:Putative translation initiation inhibitor, yjgF family
MSIEQRLADLGQKLPAPAAPVAAYVPTVESAGVLYISGQLPFREDGSLITGRLGENTNIETGAEAAKRCGLMLLAQIGAALDGDFSRIERILKLGVFVSSDRGFTDQAKVANGASELLANVLGDAGRHARSAVGVAVLPLGAVVEIDAIVAVRPS